MTHTQRTLLLNSLASMLLCSELGLASLARAEEFICTPPAVQTNSKPTCSFSRDVIAECAGLPASSVFAQCNIFALNVGQLQIRTDDKNQQYQSAIFKYSERNNCFTGDNDAISLLGQCDTFAAYAQILRNTATNQCYAVVNSALLGVQLRENSFRNNPSKWIQKLEIPGVARRITFTPVANAAIMEQPSSVLIRTATTDQRYRRAGPSISGLHWLELESPLTVKPENLKPNPAKMRITRGSGSGSDFLDIPLGKREESSLNAILSECS
jgi:hypothetical protein